MSDELSPQDRAKQAAAVRSLEFVEDGMTIGLGTGSTAAFMVAELGARVAQGLTVTGVPTSNRTKAQAEALGIRLTTLGEAGRLNLTIDGADEFDDALNLIKGAGGALLQEKIVAAASDRMVVISDPSKEVATLGTVFPVPVEVVRFGWDITAANVAKALGTADVDRAEVTRRMEGEQPYVTDEGHYLLDCTLGRIGAPAELNATLNLIPGVVETGLFCTLASTVLVGQEDGSVRVIGG
ncbi:MAG: ribose-5-phosphate isomerase RpiA [Pseudomonadota bacterium]